MSSASMSFGRPVRITFPRGATWFGSFAAWLIRSVRPAAPADADPPASDAEAWAPDDDDAPPPRCRVWMNRE